MAQYKQLVLFRFPPSVDREELAGVFEAYDDLPASIPGVVDVSAGPYFSPEGLNKGFTHAVALTFDDEAARDACLGHAAHDAIRQRAVTLLAGGLADMVVFDFKVCNRFLY